MSRTIIKKKRGNTVKPRDIKGTVKNWFLFGGFASEAPQTPNIIGCWHCTRLPSRT